MTDPIRLERLHVLLNRVMGDGEIISRPRFNARGTEAIAKHMDVSPEEVAGLVDELATKLDSVEESIDDVPNFTWETDTLGGMTVRCAKSGTEVYLGVQKAAQLQKALDSEDGTEQEKLEQAIIANESIDELSADEMNLTGSSFFNFPFKLNESVGFASAEYSGFGRNFKMKIVSAVDVSGDPVIVEDAALLKQAKEFIDHA